MKKEKLYMVIADFKKSKRNNLEIVDYNLKKEEAEDIFSRLTDPFAENGIYEIDELGIVKIIEQKGKI